MGSPCELQIYCRSAGQAKSIADAVRNDVHRLETKYSRYRSDSLLSEINRVGAARGRITVDGETADLLNYASACHEQSDGLFDITSGVLRRAWRFDKGQVPDPATVRAFLRYVGWHKVRWAKPVLEFRDAGMELDLGGIVKEYAVDRAATLCRDAGIRHGVVNFGGDIRVIGERGDGGPWIIGISHPRRKGEVLRTVPLREGALATSGDYERCIVIDGVRYSHILNPRTGWPVRHLAAVSVVGDLCVVAGSASTIAMLKEDEGPGWLRRVGLPHLWVDVQGRSGGTLVLCDNLTHSQSSLLEAYKGGLRRSRSGGALPRGVGPPQHRMFHSWREK
jgi:thiamine biosynthesis lipoprotein